MSNPGRDIVVAHTSDVHVEHANVTRLNNGDGAKPLAVALAGARAAGADLVLLCGDTFDCHRIPAPLVRRAGELVREARMPVVLLPGNHDPAIDEALWDLGGLREIDNLHILGVTCGETARFPDLDLEVWGRPHRHYGDMIPLETPPVWRARRRIAMAHGHYVPVPDRSELPRAAWLIGDEDIAACGAHYLALGHWNRAIKVGKGPTQAYYSGSPDYARTINIARFRATGEMEVERHPLDWS